MESRQQVDRCAQRMGNSRQVINEMWAQLQNTNDALGSIELSVDLVADDVESSLAGMFTINTM